MPQQETIADRILKVVRRAPGCQLDELEQNLPGLTWNQIFLEVDRLSRMGQVEVMPIGNGTYTVRLSSKTQRLVAVPNKGDQIMRPRIHSTTTTKWAEAITAKVQAVADQLGIEGHKLMDINSATADRLQCLSGIGTLYARKIVEGRPYHNTQELVTKNILRPSTYDRLKDRIVATQP
jgi:DNA uptake protein ComE-like DNA-binding protein